MFFESIDLRTDFECRAQFNVHSIHEMVLCKQQQSLSVNLLWPELCSNIMAPLKQVEEMQRLAYDSKDRVEIYLLAIYSCGPKLNLPGKELMKEHTCSTLHCEGLVSRRQSEPLLLSTLLCSLSLSCSFSLSACKRSLVVIGPGGSSSSLSIQIELEALWLLLVRWESCSC